MYLLLAVVCVCVLLSCDGVFPLSLLSAGGKSAGERQTDTVTAEQRKREREKKMAEINAELKRRWGDLEEAEWEEIEREERRQAEMLGEREMKRRLGAVQEEGAEGGNKGESAEGLESHDQFHGSRDQSDESRDQSGSPSANQSEGSHGHKGESHDESRDTSDAEEVFIQSGQVLESSDLQDASENHDEL